MPASPPVARLELLAQAAADPSLKRSELAVLIVLCRRASTRDGTCYPSLEQIAEDGAMHISNVKRAIAKLIAAGHVTRETRGGRNRATVYMIRAPDPP